MEKISRRVFLKGSAASVVAATVAPSLLSACSENRKSFKKELSVAGDYDVVVCGGGPAGFTAALAAARLGARTAVIEKYGFFGGMATMGYVAPISEFAFNGQLVIGGIPWDFVKRLEGMGGACLEWPKGNVDFDVELYKLCCQRMILEAGVDMYMHSSLIGCETRGQVIEKVIIENKNGLESLSSKLFIDCTGDADLAHMTGVPMQENPDGEVQPSSFCFVLSGVDTKTALLKDCIHHNGLTGPSQCVPVREKLLSLKAAGVALPDFGGPWFNNMLRPDSVMVNITRRPSDSTDNRNFTDAECLLREDIFTFTELLKKNFKEFEHCYVSSTAPQAGIRESRRIKGVYTVTAEEYVRAVRYDDSIGRGVHPIDIHSGKGTGQVRIEMRQPAYVPYRCLIAPDFPNLLVSGRCISTDRQTLASLRVQAACMATGQAAGAAAAIAAETSSSVQDMDIPRLVSTLKDWGAVLD